jgi:hypothetical protein
MNTRDVPVTMRIVWSFVAVGLLLAVVGIALLGTTPGLVDYSTAFLVFGCITAGTGLVARAKIRKAPCPGDLDRFYRLAPRARPRSSAPPDDDAQLP